MKRRGYSRAPSRDRTSPEGRHRSPRKASPNVHGIAKVRPRNTYRDSLVSRGAEHRVSPSYQFSWILSRSRVSQFFLMVSRKWLKSWITS